VLTAEKAASVEHFWNKKLHEDYMESQGIPFIAIRPGGFLDQVTDYLGDGIKRGDSFTLSMWDKTVPIGFIYTPDLAKYFADAIALPESANGSKIDVGWSRPVSFEEVVGITANKLSRNIRCIAVPWFLRMSVMHTVGYFNPLVKEMVMMLNYFGEGLYVNDCELQEKYFGKPPTPDEVIGRYVETLLAEKEAADAKLLAEKEAAKAATPSS
jgi:uncharacterized protein YbjT (DUF2867 family)